MLLITSVLQFTLKESLAIVYPSPRLSSTSCLPDPDFPDRLKPQNNKPTCSALWSVALFNIVVCCCCLFFWFFVYEMETFLENLSKFRIKYDLPLYPVAELGAAAARDVWLKFELAV